MNTQKNASSKESEAHENRTLTNPLSDLHVLKSGDSFGVVDRAGDINFEDHSPGGIFVNDMRLLSEWRLRLSGANLQVLNSCIDDDHILFTAHLSSKKFTDLKGNAVHENDIYIRREQFLKKGTLYERLTIENHYEHQTRFKLAIAYGSDFYDMFQVRGLKRLRQGTITETETDTNTVRVGYKGLDDKLRSTTICFSEAPAKLGRSLAEFILELKKGESRVIVISAGSDTAPTDDAKFEKTLQSVRQQLRRRLDKWTPLEIENKNLKEWLERSKVGISLLTTLRSTGLYPYAGIPWFSTPFGRDGIITALQTLWLNPEIAKGVLTFLAKTQAMEYDAFRDAEPGKILHELRECEMAETREVPYGKYYGSIDSTPLFIILAAAYYRETQDMGLISDLWPAIEAAVSWMERDGDADGDGFLEYQYKEKTGLYNQGWKDSWDSVFHADGSIAELPIAICEVQAYAYAAYKAAAELSEELGHDEKAKLFRAKAQQIYDRTNEVFWSEDLGCYALALDGNKKPCLVRTSNNGHMLWCGIAPRDRAEKITDMLMGQDFFTGWGIRTIAKGETRYNPLSYHNGSVWPHDTAIAAAGMARYGFHDKAEIILDSLLRAAQDCRSDWLPELFCGFSSQSGHDLVRYPAACTLQAWACGAIFMALQAAMDKDTRSLWTGK